MAAMNSFIVINSLVERCCWKSPGGEMEGEAFLEECIALKEVMANMKEIYMKLLYDRDHLLMMVEMYHCSFKREMEEYERLHTKWESTYDSLK